MKRILILLVVLFSLSSCDQFWYITDGYGNGNGGGETDPTDQPFYLQVQACGGVGNTYATYKDHYFAYVGESGDSVYWYRYDKQDNLTNNFNLFKFMAHKFDQDTIYTNNEEDEILPSFQAVIKDIQPLDADSVVYIAPQLRTKFEGVLNFYPVSDEYPVHVRECIGWAELGDTIYLTY